LNFLGVGGHHTPATFISKRLQLVFTTCCSAVTSSVASRHGDGLVRLHTFELTDALNQRNWIEDVYCTVTDRKCHLGILDRGPGIPVDQIETMFQPFHRLDASRSPVTGGSGLGLAIVRELARANGWEINLSARAGGGLEAWIVIPVSTT